MNEDALIEEAIHALNVIKDLASSNFDGSVDYRAMPEGHYFSAVTQVVAAIISRDKLEAE